MSGIEEPRFDLLRATALVSTFDGRCALCEEKFRAGAAIRVDAQARRYACEACCSSVDSPEARAAQFGGRPVIVVPLGPQDLAELRASGAFVIESPNVALLLAHLQVSLSNTESFDTRRKRDWKTR